MRQTPRLRRRRRRIPTMWTTADVAGALGLTAPSVSQRVSQGKLPSPDGRLGGTPWWWPSTIRRWARQHGQRLHPGPAPEPALRPVDPARSLAVVLPDIAAEWHPTRNPYGPESVGPAASRRAWWQCRRCGHEWQAWIHHRAKGTGCPRCGRSKRAALGRSVAELRPDLLAQWHPTRNGDRRPDELSLGSGVLVWWRCPRCGHEWQHTPNQRHRSTRDCPACSA